MQTITEVFIKDHKEMGELLNEFLTAQINKQNNINDLFNIVRNALDEHIKEEEQMYHTYETRNKELDEIIKTVRTQHETIKKILEDIGLSEEINEEYEQLVRKLLQTIQEHEEFEEEYLYPKFDEVLTNREKEQTIFQLTSKEKVHH